MGKRAVVKHPGWRRNALAVGLLVFGGLFAYANCFHCPFELDDIGSIVNNPTIRPPLHWRVLWPHLGGETASGRPFFNLTLALNRVTHGTAVEGYHAANLLLHQLAGLVLYALILGTLALPGIPPWLARQRSGFSLAVALLWLLHPLQTAAVTYLSQRCEVLAGLFYLLTLLCLLRGNGSPRPLAWYVACVAACLLGMASKEVMVSAPLVALLYDLAFLTGSFREAMRRRGWLYLALFLTWVPLGLLMALTGGRGGSAGLGTAVSATSYFLAQPNWILHYLRLSIVPWPLVFDYGPVIPQLDARGVAALVIVSALFLATLAAMVRWPKAGLLGLGFFAVLAPTSSFVPIATQVAAEHRMYLPLAAVLILLAVAVAWGLERWSRQSPPANWIAVVPVAALVMAFGVLTYLRNRDYATSLGLWTDSAAKAPANPRNWNAIGAIYHERGDPALAMEYYRRARDIAPNHPVAHYNIAVLLQEQGDLTQAEAEYRTALQLRPNDAPTLLNLGSLLVGRGETDEGVSQFEEAVRLTPLSSLAHLWLGEALSVKGDWNRAVEQLERAIQLDPRNASAYRLLGDALESAGRLPEAEETLRKSLPILTGNDGPSLATFVRVLLRQGKDQEAEFLLERMVKLPESPLRVHAIHLTNLLALHPWDQAAAPPIPAPAAGLAELAAYCRKELLFDASAARLYIWAVAADPSLFEDRRSLRRFDAACAGLRAGKGLGNDSYRTGKEQRFALARQGLSWLEAELGILARLAQGGPSDRSEARRALIEWENSRSLPGNRDGPDAESLTVPERESLTRLRAQAKALLLSLNGQAER
jgi:protein O-mannosyl-transferase